MAKKQAENVHREHALSKRWQARIKNAQSERGAVIVRGNQLLANVKGIPNEEINSQLEKKFQERTGVSLYYPVPVMPSYLNSLIPTILRQSPRTMVRPSDARDPVSVGVARCQKQFLDSVWTDASRLDHNRLAVFQSLIYGVGAVLHEYDVHAKRPTATHLDTRCLLLDRFGTQAPGTMSWIGLERVLAIDVARKMFDDPKLQPNLQSLQSTSGGGDTKPDPMTYPANSLDAMRVSQAYDESQTDAANERIKVIIIYERAGAPQDESVKLADLQRDPDENGGFSGRDRKLTFDAYTFKLLKEEPWGFTLNRGEFPITLFWPTIDPEDPWAYSLLDPVKRLQDMIDLCNSLVASDVRQSSRTVNLVNETLLADGPTFLTDLSSGKQHVNAKTVNAKTPADVFSSKRLMELDDSSVKVRDSAIALFDNVTNRQGLMSAQGLGYSTATGAEVAQRRTQTSVQNPTISVERALREQQVKDIQIAWSIMTGAEAKLYCGSLVGEETKETGSNGKEVVSYQFWPENPTVREIRSVDVWIQPNSTLETSGAERARTIMELIKTLIEFVGASANLGLQANPQKYAELFLDPIKAAVSSLDMPEVEQMIDNGLTGLFEPRPDSMPPDQQAATKGELQQAMDAAGQQFGQAIQQMQQGLMQQFQQIAQAMQQTQQQMQAMGQVLAQQGEAVTALAEGVKELSTVVQRHEVALSGGGGMIAPPAPEPMMPDPMMGMGMPEPMPTNSMGIPGAREPGFDGRL